MLRGSELTIVALAQWIRVSSLLSKVTLYYTYVRSLHYFGGSGGVIPYRGSHYKVAYIHTYIHIHTCLFVIAGR